MGMFLSQFSMLKAIGYGEDGQIKEETEKILEPYKLFVLVLHDPERHTSFHYKFSQLFERLDYLTGPNLLFMGIAKPSYDWYNRNKERDFFGIWEKKELLRSLHEIKGGDGSITCYSIAKALNIDYDDLPCLVISSDFRSNHFVALKTGEMYIESQLLELGIFAGSVIESRIEIHSKSFQSLLRNIDYYDESEYTNHHEALGASLADVLSFSVPENNHFGRDAKLHATSVFNKIKNSVKKFDNAQDIENAKMNLLANLANKFKSSSKPILNLDITNYQYKRVEDIPCTKLQVPTRQMLKKINSVEPLNVEFLLNKLQRDRDFLEPETNIIVSTTDAVYRMFMASANREILDFSPLVLGLSKIFEIETNLSVVHWVRKHLSIKMPDYYKKFSPECADATVIPDTTLVTNPKAIDFNMRKGVKWQAPGIGQSELAVQSLFKRNVLIESFSENEENAFLHAWSPIRKMRNKAAHIEVMKESDFKSVADSIQTLSTTNNLNKIMQLKQLYKGES